MATNYFAAFEPPPPPKKKTNETRLFFRYVSRGVSEGFMIQELLLVCQ